MKKRVGESGDPGGTPQFSKRFPASRPSLFVVFQYYVSYEIYFPNEEGCLSFCNIRNRKKKLCVTNYTHLQLDDPLILKIF